MCVQGIRIIEQVTITLLINNKHFNKNIHLIKDIYLHHIDAWVYNNNNNFVFFMSFHFLIYYICMELLVLLLLC